MTSGADYWRQFIYTVSFLEPCQIVGTVEKCDEPIQVQDGPAPVLVIRSPDGLRHRVNAVQARLLEELGKAQPVEGDKIRITYHGEAKRAAPGMSPKKEFTVEVRRQGSQPEAGTETVRGSAGSEGKTTQ